MKQLFLFFFSFFQLISFAQIQVDKPIVLTSTTDSERAVTNLALPVQGTDAANKDYVDAAISSNLPSASNMSFSLTCDKSSLIVPTSGNTLYNPATLNCGYISGDASPVSFKVTGAPSGLTWNITAGGGFPTFSSTLIFYASAAATPGTYTVTITAAGGISNQSVNISVEIQSSKRVFITSTAYTGSMGGLSGADNLCQSAANNASLGSAWVAWLSTGSLNSPTISAASRVTQINGPYVRTDGVVIAMNWNDLIDSSIMSPITKDEYQGAVPQGTYVWTNTRQNGLPGNSSNTSLYHCNAWNSGSSGQQGWVGEAYNTGSSWTQYSNFSCDNSYRIYCFEQ